ncbi:MAG: HIT domain-containing protein [Ardenticatenia bacterium]|nr:HIT domain-containing protein [Ardenticatenia bacterium]
MKNDCTFCRIIHGLEHGAFIHQDELVVAFLDINQASPGHTLIVPRIHVPSWWELPDEEAAAVARVAKPIMQALRMTLEPDGINLVQNNGRAAGQVIFHVHMHVIPRWQGDRRFGRPPAYADRHTLDKRAAQLRAALHKIGCA